MDQIYAWHEKSYFVRDNLKKKEQINIFAINHTRNYQDKKYFTLGREVKDRDFSVLATELFVYS